MLGDDDDQLVIVDRGAPRSKLIRVADLQPNPENPRPPDLDVHDMVESLKLSGQLQNINVMGRNAFLREKPYLADAVSSKPYVVINGRCRMLAAPQAGLDELKYEQHDEWTAEQIDRAVILENEDRLEVNPLLLGRYLARMLQRYGSQRELGRTLGKGQAWVQQRIGLTTLDETLQDAIGAGRIQFKLARACTRLAPELQPRLAAGELPADVASAWLITLKLKPDEQLTRFAAGQPYDIDPTLAGGEKPTDAAAVDEKEPAAAPEDPQKKDTPTGDNTRDSKPRPIVIRIAERTPRALAGALRKEFTEQEISELVQALTGI